MLAPPHPENGNKMVSKNFKRLLALLAVTAIAIVVYGLLIMPEKRNPIGMTGNAIHQLLPGADTGKPPP